MRLHEDIRRLDALSSGYQRSQILFAALQYDVFTQLDTPKSAEAVAAALGWPERSARMLLDGLVALELLARDAGGGYRNTRIATACLVPGGPMDQTHILAHRANARDAWAALPEVLPKGRPVLPSEPTPEQRRDFIRGMNDIARESARELAATVDLSGRRHLLDLGAGSGAYTAAILGAHPEMRATIFDLPGVLPITRECLEGTGTLDRISFRAGDLRQDSLGSAYDLILVSNVIHSFSWEANEAIVGRCHDALEAGGLLILKDFLRDPDRAGPAYGLVFALHMFLTTDAGDTYSVEDTAAWTRAAGFASAECLELTPQSRLWLARK